MPDIRFVNCDTCGTEGMLEHGHPNAPEPDWTEICPDCKGECVVEVEVEPIELEDLPPPANPTSCSPFKSTEKSPVSQMDTTNAIRLDYETRAALGLNDKTAFSCMPSRAKDLVEALRSLVAEIDKSNALGDGPGPKALLDARRVLAGYPL